MFDKFDKIYLKLISECDDNVQIECDDNIQTECDDNVQTEAEKVVNRKIISISTDNQQLIDALTGPFDKVVFYVTDEDADDDEEIINEVEFTRDEIGEISVVDDTSDDNEVKEGIKGTIGGAIAGGLAAGPLGAVAGGLLGSEL